MARTTSTYSRNPKPGKIRKPIAIIAVALIAISAVAYFASLRRVWGTSVSVGSRHEIGVYLVGGTLQIWLTESPDWDAYFESLKPGDPLMMLGGTTKEVAVPLWFVVVVGAVLLGALRISRPARVKVGHCIACGYNLTGNVSGRCPECGAATGDAACETTSQ